LRQKVGPLGRGPGQDKQGLKKLKLPSLWRHQQKNLKPTKFFLIESTRLATSIEGVNSSLAQSPGELWPAKIRDSKGFNHH